MCGGVVRGSILGKRKHERRRRLRAWLLRQCVMPEPGEAIMHRASRTWNVLSTGLANGKGAVLSYMLVHCQ